MSIQLRLASIGFLLLSVAPLFAEDSAFSDEDIAYFERKIRPLLAERCYSCHSKDAKVLHGELRLDSSAGLRQGGESGPLLVPGNPEESLLIQAVQYEDGLEMPPKGKLPEAEVAELVAWVKRGAPMPPVKWLGLQRRLILKRDANSGRSNRCRNMHFPRLNLLTGRSKRWIISFWRKWIRKDSRPQFRLIEPP